MWDHETGSKIAAILALIADPPNLRGEGGIKVFDGGRLIEDTGISVYELTDGTKVLFGSGLGLSVTITFPSGDEVQVSVKEAG